MTPRIIDAIFGAILVLLLTVFAWMLWTNPHVQAGAFTAVLLFSVYRVCAGVGGWFRRLVDKRLHAVADRLERLYAWLRTVG